MIAINNLCKNYGKRVLFSNINLMISRGEKIGLIGPNGAGKSTLFSIILSESEPSSGSLQINKGIRIGYLPQESSFLSTRTVLSELTQGDEEIIKLKEEKALLEKQNAAGSGRYGDILHQLDVSGYFELEHKAKKILMGLGFKERDFDRPINQMSGGWQMRTLLAKLLTFEYDLLLLDEPTNYLDLNAALWLKDYLAEFKGTFLMISHDRVFLNEVTNFTLILENGSIFKVRGSYEHYEQIKEEKRKFLVKQFKEQEKKREQLEKFVSRFHAQPNKASQVRAKRSALERMQEVNLLPDIAESIRDFHFPQTRRSGERVIRLNKIFKAYADIQVYQDFDFEISRGEKAVLAGENGAGKSTLLKILAGVVEIDKGERIIGHNVEIGYFSQTRMDVLNPDNSVLDEAYSAAAGFMKQEAIRTVLGAFLFCGDDVDKKVKVLSGGEKSRLILAKLLINPPNFLLLDEPTTHLDIDATDALIKALNEYDGTIVFISHDIYFVRSLANCVFEVKDGIVRKFPGEFDYYLQKRGSSANVADRLKKREMQGCGKKSASIELAPDLLADNEEKVRTYNAQFKLKITKLKKEHENLRLARSAKIRTIENPHSYHDEASLVRYKLELAKIEVRIGQINNEIRKLKKQVIREDIQ